MYLPFERVAEYPKTGRIDYDHGDEAWCGMCGSRRKPNETKVDKCGRILCVKCGRRVRANPHNKKWRKIKPPSIINRLRAVIGR